MAELQAAGLSEDEAAEKAEEEVVVEETAEMAKIDEDIADELKHDQSKKLSDALSLYTDKDKDKDILKAKMAEQEEESKRLAAELQHQKDQRAKALKERLAKKKNSRAAELQQEGLSEDEALLKADMEVADEEAAEILQMDDEVAEKMKAVEEEKSKMLDGLCDEEAKRIADEIEAERVVKLAEMNAKLEAERFVQIILLHNACTVFSAQYLSIYPPPLSSFFLHILLLLFQIKAGSRRTLEGGGRRCYREQTRSPGRRD
jgi:colicin import membrane protein